jgi:2-polyprenyl-3-methyl-5-hydroxy-6-metoxy-1,4-benzoquinol methylase
MIGGPEIGTSGYWDKIYSGVSNAEPGAPGFDRLTPVHEEIRRLEKIVPMDKVLDVGAGWGDFARQLQEGGYLVTALDFSMEAARRSRFKPYIVADAANTGLPAKSFDLITCLQAVEYMLDMAAFFREAARLARTLIFTVTHGEHETCSQLRIYTEESLVAWFAEEARDFDLPEVERIDIKRVGPMLMTTIHWRVFSVASTEHAKPSAERF